MLLGGIEVPLWLILVGLITILAYLYGTRTFHVFKKSGIPGPKPWPFIGTLLDLYGDSLMASDLKFFKKYGKFVGTYEGALPVLMVYDAEWLKEAFVKHFSVFTDRRRQLFGGTLDQGIFFLEGEHWKHSRKMLSPEFSSGKLKKMMPIIQKCGGLFVSGLGRAQGEPVDVRKKTNVLTLDLISNTAFGIECDAQTNDDSVFAKNAFLLISSTEAEQSLLERIRVGTAITLFLLAPNWVINLASKLFNIGLFDVSALTYFEDLCKSVIESRRNDTPGNDFVQTLANNIVVAPKGHPDTLVDPVGFQWTKKGFTKDEVTGNAILFLFAGFQTTADTLLFVFYELAQYPDIQQKLYEEIKAICNTEEVTVEQVNQLKYLERCINEALRLYPQGFRFDRTALEDITVRDIHVPKGTAINVSPWAIHRDPEIWEDPEEFDPDRFLPERYSEQQATAFMPFGIGNRHCIGSRLALMEMKMAVILALKHYTVEKCARTPDRPLTFAATAAITPEKTIFLNFIKR